MLRPATIVILPFSIALAMIAWSSPIAAAVVTFRDGTPTPFVGGVYAGTSDTMLYSNTGQLEDQNFGARTNMEAGQVDLANNRRRSLIRFDVTALSGQVSSIDSVTLRLFVTNIGELDNGLDVKGSETVQAFRPTTANSAWIEGSGVSGPFATPDNGMSTFAQRVQGSQNWAGSAGLGTPGIDYLIVPVASQTFGANTSPGGAFDLVFTDVSFMSDWAAGSNSGLFLRTQFEASNNAAISFFTRNAANLNVRPELIVSYTLIGDYNQNDVVDAADYIVWRKTLGQTGSGLAADGNGNNQIDPGDYDVWSANFGKTAGSGATAGLPSSVLVPEPTSLLLLLCSLIPSLSFGGRATRRGVVR
jgi:hypothetical protein